MKEIITTIKIDDDGNVIGTSTEAKVIEPAKKEEVNKLYYSEYSRVFDWESQWWRKDAESNMAFLKHVERKANLMIRERSYKSYDGIGRLYLNEVYDMLGLSRTPAGAMVCWTYSEFNPIPWSYNRVEIIYNKPLGRLGNYAILLDFNVDGNLLDLI